MSGVPSALPSCAAIAVGAGVFCCRRSGFWCWRCMARWCWPSSATRSRLWRALSEVRPVWSKFRLPVAKHMFGDGVAFSACTLIAVIVEHNFCGWLIGRTEGRAATRALLSSSRG